MTKRAKERKRGQSVMRNMHIIILNIPQKSNVTKHFTHTHTQKKSSSKEDENEKKTD